MKFTAVAVDAKKNEVRRCADILNGEKLATLSSLQRGDSGVIIKVEGEDLIVRRLLEMGFVEGALVEVLHEAPFGKDPIAVRVRGALLALRRHEARCILLKKA